MSMNILYGILTGGAASGYYAKKHSVVFCTQRSRTVRSQLLDGVPDTDIPRLACYICWASLNTAFGDDIRKLDPNNTYDAPVRDPDATSPGYTLTGLINGHRDMAKLHSMLDIDIRERLSVPTWIETVAACCLQILRGVV